MAVNRYRLKSLVKAGHRGARLAERLLVRTDKLLGVILLGNNLVNAAAAALVTVIAFRLFGENEYALSLATVCVTFLILVFSEVSPKVMGAAYPERVAPVVSYVLSPLLKLMQPAVWFINLFVNALLRLLRLRPPDLASGSVMGVEELRTLLAESGHMLPKAHRGILLNLFDLEKITVDDVMRPRGQIEAIDLLSHPDELYQELATSHHARVLAYEGEVNNVVGIVKVRRVLAHCADGKVDMDTLREQLRQPYFIPSGTPLLTQLHAFQETHQTFGLVVDEYGDLLGLVTVDDILEEIVGEFAAASPLQSPLVIADEDGSWLVEGSSSIRELNRRLGLALPQEDARTLNGLILEHLEAMPEAGVSVMIAGYPMEVIQVQDRMVKTARIYPRRPEAGETRADL
ncbi:Mg2+/Co2+ transporter CorB [Sulfuritortus calidifontis]|uniref:Mg2+/Co2+ transporter CorB n=2 Tax=Sulfuritortus calidifontis TaxID=1914471 RepID=A0A4R3JZH0_9PROT|nr:Mg2+/Co2+ transporter CorB [Sulfuritortus calidifontis]